jgi:hypothetical protein
MFGGGGGGGPRYFFHKIAPCKPQDTIPPCPILQQYPPAAVILQSHQLFVLAMKTWLGLNVLSIISFNLNLYTSFHSFWYLSFFACILNYTHISFTSLHVIIYQHTTNPVLCIKYLSELNASSAEPWNNLMSVCSRQIVKTFFPILFIIASLIFSFHVWHTVLILIHCPHLLNVCAYVND